MSRSTLSAWRGKRIDDMSRDELVIALNEMHASYTAIARSTMSGHELDGVDMDMQQAGVAFNLFQTKVD